MYPRSLRRRLHIGAGLRRRREVVSGVADAGACERPVAVSVLDRRGVRVAMKRRADAGSKAMGKFFSPAVTGQVADTEPSAEREDRDFMLVGDD